MEQQQTDQKEQKPTGIIVGVDEAGRGAFFSRMYSAAVVYDPDIVVKAHDKKIVIRDSKKMTPKQRISSYDFLMESCLFGVGFCDEKEIDTLGITRCNVLSMHRALDNLLEKYPHLQISKINVDGVLFKPYRDIPSELIVHGDTKNIEIAMASIIAKTHRDLFITDLCEKDPSLDEKYNIKNNKGYGTAKHIQGIRRYGLHPYHRKTFVRNHYRGLTFLR